MERPQMNKYYTYIVTDNDKAQLETGATGSLSMKLQDMEQETPSDINPVCKYILYWEEHEDAVQAIMREKELKKLSRKKKENLINKSNPEWRFLNEEI
jgi:putative endonuclease